MRTVLLFFQLVFFCLTPTPYALTPAVAQSVAISSAETHRLVEAADGNLTEIERALTTLEGKVSQASDNEAKLAEARLELEAIIRSISDVRLSLQPRLNVVQERLTALGDAPAEGAEPEDNIVLRERESLTAERAAITGLLGRADDLSQRATELGGSITDARRSVFTNTLFQKTAIDSSVFSEAAEAFSSQWQALVVAVTSWLGFAWKFKRLALLGAIFLSLLTALVFVAAGYRVFGPLVRRDPQLKEPSYISRLSVAFWATVLQAASLAAFVGSSYLLLDGFNVLRPDIAPLLGVLAQVIVAFFFIYMVTRAVLAPVKPNWRLVNVTNRGAWALSFSVYALAIVNSGDYLLAGVYDVLNAPLVLTVVNSFIASVAAGLIFVQMAFIRPFPSGDAEFDVRGEKWPPVVRLLLIATGLLLIVASLLGYVGFARFVSTQIVLTGALVVTMAIGMISGKAVSEPGALGATYVGRKLKERFHLGDVAMDQASLAVAFGIYFLVLAVGLPLILLQWGFYAQDIWLWVKKITTQIQIGGINISLMSIFVGILLFFLGLYLIRWLLAWIDGNVLARSNLDAGVRNSLRTGMSYVGAAVAGLIGISAAGIDLSSLALVAGALSLGIGFGLQNVVSNFVSGLILLAERPFKVGDWVVTGSTEGIVKRISVRATEIETFQFQSIIVPNSELINASLGNWTHRNKLGRCDVGVGASYDSDPQQVTDILLEIGRGHPKALKNPEPSVEFVGFGESSLDFNLRIFLANVLDGFNTRNDLRLAIFKRFREEGIEIPFPQRDLNIRMSEVTGLRPETKPAKKRAPAGKKDAQPVGDDMGGLDDGDGDGR